MPDACVFNLRRCSLGLVPCEMTSAYFSPIVPHIGDILSIIRAKPFTLSRPAGLNTQYKLVGLPNKC